MVRTLYWIGALTLGILCIGVCDWGVRTACLATGFGATAAARHGGFASGIVGTILSIVFAHKAPSPATEETDRA